MTQVTLKQLRYFDALARELHFGRAADSCAVTQPALSMQIHEMEQNLGLALVERTKSGVQLTAKGQEIAARCARILGDVRDLVAYAQHANRILAGTLRLGVIPSVAPYLLPPLLPLLREAYPELELHVRETQTQILTDELLEGKLDVLLLVGHEPRVGRGDVAADREHDAEREGDDEHGENGSGHRGGDDAGATGAHRRAAGVSDVLDLLGVGRDVDAHRQRLAEMKVANVSARRSMLAWPSTGWRPM